MKTVIQVVQHLTPGGIEVMALELKRLIGQSARTLIVSLEGNEEDALHLWPFLESVKEDLIFLNKSPGLTPETVKSLTRIFNANAPCAVHTHHIGPLLYGGIAARVARVPTLVHTEHDAWHLQNPKRRFLERVGVTFLRPILVADANIVADEMHRHLRQKNITVVKNGIDVEKFCPGNQTKARQQLGLPKNTPLLGASGRLEPVKGHKYLLEAMADQRDTTIHLAIAGDGSQKQSLEGQARELGLANRVHFLGRVDDMPQFYRALDIFCLPSLCEGMPLAPLEAQACGVPAILSDAGGAKEALCQDTGILVPPADSQRLYQAIMTMFSRLPTDPEKATPRTFVENSANILDMASAYASLCNISGEFAS